MLWEDSAGENSEGEADRFPGPADAGQLPASSTPSGRDLTGENGPAMTCFQRRMSASARLFGPDCDPDGNGMIGDG